MQFAEYFPDDKIVSAVSTQLAWLHLLQLNKSGIKVAQYMTELPSKELLQRQIHKGLEAARQRWENCQDN